MTKKHTPPISRTPQIGINEQYGFPNIYPSNEISLYYILEFAKRYLLEPISWVKRPSTIPQCIKELNPDPLVLLYKGNNFFERSLRNYNLLGHNEPLNEKAFTLLDNEIKSEITIERLKNAIYSFYNLDENAKNVGLTIQEWQDVIDVENENIELYFARNSEQAIFRMINNLRYYVFLSLGIKTTNSVVYDDHEKELLKCQKDIQELRDFISQKATPNQQIIMALCEEVRGKVLIVRNEKYPRYYMRNKDFTPRNQGKWFENAEKRIKDKGLKKPNWAELGRNYIRQENGNEYKNFIKEIKRW